MIRCLVLIALLTGAAVTRADEAAAPAGPLPDTVVPANYQLRLTIDPRRANFSGQTVIEVAIRAPLRTIWLHGLGLRLKSATVTESGHTFSAHYEEIDHDTGVARLVTAAPLTPGTAVLRFDYEAPFQSSPQGLYRTRVGKDWYAFSQMEAIDARRVFPGFDEPRFKTPFVVAIATRGADLAVTNAPELHAAKTPAGTTLRTYETTKPLPTYLIAFAVGPLQILEGAPVAPNAVRHTPLPLRISAPKAMPRAFSLRSRRRRSSVTRLEDYFGIAFPYPKIDLIASPIHLGAMENAGAIIFGEDYLAFAQPPTPRQQSRFGSVAAHELAHQWFGTW